VEWYRKSRSFYAPESISYPMPRDRSVDIDTEFDLAMARILVL